MELAAKYCNCIMPESAWKKFRRWMHLYPGLMEQLAAIGYTERSRSFTPAQVRLIVDAWASREIIGTVIVGLPYGNRRFPYR